MHDRRAVTSSTRHGAAATRRCGGYEKAISDETFIWRVGWWNLMQSRAITCYLEEVPAGMASGRDRKTWTKAQRHEYLRFGVREAVPGNAQQALRGGAGKKSTGKARQCKSIGGASARCERSRSKSLGIARRYCLTIKRI